MQTYVAENVATGDRVFIEAEFPDGTVRVRTAAGQTAFLQAIDVAAETARAELLGEFVGESEGELSVMAGDEITVLQPEQLIPDGWLLAVANNAAVGFVPESFVKILPGEVAPPPPVAVSDEPSPPKAQPAVATVYSPSAVLAAVTKPLSASLEVVQGVVEDVAETTGGLLASGLHEAIGVVGSRTNAPPQLKVTVVVGLSDFQPESEEEIQMRTDGTPP